MDNIVIYLNEIGRYNVLSQDEELELFMKIDNLHKENAYYESLDDDKILKEDNDKYLENKTLIELYTNKLVNSNLKLVVSIAKELNIIEMPLMDLIQEGNMGLLHAIEKFDYTKGYKLTTYATWWIKQYITRAAQEKKRTIRIPSHVVEQLSKLCKEKNVFIAKYNREPSDNELCEILNITKEKLFELSTLARVNESLDRKIEGHENTTFGDFCSEDENNPLEKCICNDNKKILYEKLNLLSEREKQVLMMRKGFYGKVYTLDEVGKKINTTRERVRQIENAAIHKLRISYQAR